MGHWKPTFHNHTEKGLPTHKCFCAIWSTQVISSFFAKVPIEVTIFFFLNILRNVFSYSCRKPPTSHFLQGEALPHFHYAVQRSLMYTLPGMDWTLFQRLTCLWNSGLQISQNPHKVTSCEDVSRSSMSVPLLPCSLEGKPLQLWTWTRYVTRGLRKWPTGMTCALRQERSTPGICQIIEIPVVVSLQDVYGLPSRYEITHFWEQFCLFEIKFVEEILHAMKCRDLRLMTSVTTTSIKIWNTFVTPKCFLMHSSNQYFSQETLICCVSL